jgi:hydrogenase/urease accessory protein HupE
MVLMLTISSVSAHEARPAYLEITESANNHLRILWKQPMRSDKVLSIQPLISELPLDEKLARNSFVSGASIKQWMVNAGEKTIEGRQVMIEGLQFTMTDALVRINFADGSGITQILKPDSPTMTISREARNSIPVWGFLQLGVEHILLGIDHLLFVLGLLLIVQGRVVLLKTITAFTIAHSITLALAVLGFVNVPQAPVEAVIALSIVFLASELIKQQHGKVGLTAQYPWLVAFIFGLLHGFGFAGALSEIGLPQNDIPMALFLFNVGVEVGQLIFVAAMIASIALVKKIKIKFPNWSEAVTPYIIGSVAAFWLIERVMAFF